MAKEDIKAYEFKKGQSGNPNGRPRVLPELKEILSKDLSEESNGYSKLEVIIKQLNTKAARGDLRAIQEVLDRFYGKPNQAKEEKPVIDGAEAKEVARLRDAIIDKHYRHFEKGYDWTISMGGSRSGKTYNFLLWALLQTKLGKFDLSIIAPSHKMLDRGAFDDVRKIFAEFAPDVHIPARPTYIEIGDSIWNFEVVTSESEAKRNRVNVFVNEADGISQTIANLLGRASGRKFVDFNPVKKFWAHEKVNENGDNILVSKWQDNPFLTESQLAWFADLKRYGEKAEVGSPERYAYDVYYLGDYSMLSGSAFERSDFNWVTEYPECDFYMSYSDPSLGDGNDFFATILFGVKGTQAYAIDCIFSQHVKVGGFVEVLKEWDAGRIIDHYSEMNGVSGIPTKAAREIYDGTILPINNSDNKRGDIMVYAPFAKRIKYVESQRMKLFVEQCINFPADAHDDAPDCLCRGAKILKQNYDI